MKQVVGESIQPDGSNNSPNPWEEMAAEVRARSFDELKPEERPAGVRDERDYQEYLEEQKARQQERVVLEKRNFEQIKEIENPYIRNVTIAMLPTLYPDSEEEPKKTTQIARVDFLRTIVDYNSSETHQGSLPETLRQRLAVLRRESKKEENNQEKEETVDTFREYLSAFYSSSTGRSIERRKEILDQDIEYHSEKKDLRYDIILRHDEFNPKSERFNLDRYDTEPVSSSESDELVLRFMGERLKTEMKEESPLASVREQLQTQSLMIQNYYYTGLDFMSQLQEMSRIASGSAATLGLETKACFKLGKEFTVFKQTYADYQKNLARGQEILEQKTGGKNE